MKMPRLNAVLYKDMQQKVKKSNFAITLFVINGLMFLVALCTIAIMFGNNYYSNIDNQMLIYLFIGLIIAECVFICFAIPSFTAGSISGEREKQTLDVLLTTRMSPWEIVKGKFLSSISQIIMVMITGLPIFALVFIYGGITFFQMLAVLLVIMAGSMYMASFGVYFSAALKKTLNATVLTYLSLVLLFLGTILVTVLPIALIEEINAYIYYLQNGTYNYQASNFINIDWLTFLLYTNPLTTVFDVMGTIFGGGSGYNDLCMAALIDEITDYSESNVLLKYWSVIGSIVQLGLTYVNLKLAARVLNPLRKKKVKVKGAHHERKGSKNS